METKYAFGYVRVSTGKQDELSPDSQAKLLKDYAKSHGYVVSKIFLNSEYPEEKQISDQNSRK